MPYAKMANSMEGQETVHSVVGPMAHSAAGEYANCFFWCKNLTGKDLRLFLTSVLGQEPWKYDSKVIPMPWRPTEEEVVKLKTQGGLNLGYYSCDGVVSYSSPGDWIFQITLIQLQVLPHPPILRGIETVVSTLKQNGHSVIPWTPYKHDFGFNLINGIYAADGNTVRNPS